MSVGGRGTNVRTLNTDGTVIERASQLTRERDLTSCKSRRSTTDNFISTGRVFHVGVEDMLSVGRRLLELTRDDVGHSGWRKGEAREAYYV